MTSPSYFANVFNTDPMKIEEEGHLLYSHYDITPGMAVVTGSGILSAGNTEKGAGFQDAAILTTGSRGRNVGDGTAPNYENFEDRSEFSYAISFGEPNDPTYHQYYVTVSIMTEIDSTVLGNT